MNDKIMKLGYALIDAFFNALAIFTLTLGGMILTSSSISSVTLEPAVVTAGAVALIRFSLRLYQEDGINMEGLDSLPGVPEVDNDKKFLKNVELDTLNVLCL